jgi:hypothetical protein
MTADQTPFRDIGWNGIRLTVPGDWEIREIGQRYLFLENDSGPVMEIKWEPVRGRFSHDKHLRRLAGLQRHPSIKHFGERRLPSMWESTLKAFQARCFSWEGLPYGGIGLTLYCGRCGKATLIQFFRKNPSENDRLFHDILASFRDHGNKDGVLWSLYDIKAKTPAEFKLLTYRLDAGAFELAFAANRLKATLYRWGPAAVLLGNRGLKDFAGSVFRLPVTEPGEIKINGMPGIQWRSSMPTSRSARLMNRIWPGWAHHHHTLWHVPEKNRILGIGVVGKSAIKSSLIESLCSTYENL